jgi:hypothetical protein
MNLDQITHDKTLANLPSINERHGGFPSFLIYLRPGSSCPDNVQAIRIINTYYS